ncbi:flagellar hook-associated protein FlgK [Polynucleobacter duraquae]|uniref:Flagellar hook-associated protein 1 n=1 Tax=Polynucleobacter duraquae TaxID=1835254 RepID=A0A0E3ZL98_9BURK|nr:flagellar hook-associated protein FlgK [Polynucleobacter duraquae]AKD24797.1 flagellar hook-associated protein FlgK [Polynucleobacter duraquae]
MGVYSITDSAMAALNIAQAGVLITSQNVAGASVDGFTRRSATATINAMAPNNLMLNGTSFAVGGFTRQYSALVNGQLLNQEAKSSYSDTLVQYTQSIDTLVSGASTGLNSAISNFFNAMGTYAADPTSKSQAAAITAAANDVAQRMTGITSLVSQIEDDAEKGLSDTAEQVNTLLPALAQINQKIIESTSAGNSTPSADLLDERDRLSSQLQKLVGGQTLINGDGTVTQLVGGMALVEGAMANKLLINSSGTYSLKSGTNNSTILNIQDLDGGQAGALLELANSFVPKINQRLDSLAIGLVKVANTAIASASSGVGLFGFEVGSATIFDLDDDSTAYADDVPDIALDSWMTTLYSDLGDSGNSMTSAGLVASNFVSIAPQDPSTYFDDDGEPIITSDLANTTSNRISIFANATSSLVSDVGVQVASWRSSQKADQAVLKTLTDERDSISGVNLDEEAANLLKYQQLYSASTKVLQVDNQMFTALLSIMN